MIFILPGVLQQQVQGTWTPAEIAVALWLDGDDASTITLTSGKVSQWADKSGNARHATQADSAKRPVVSAGGIGGLDVIDFAGSEIRLEVSRGFITSAISAFVVTQGESVTNQRVLDQRGTGAAGAVKGWVVRSRPNGGSFVMGQADQGDATNARGGQFNADPGSASKQSGMLFPVGGDIDQYLDGTLQTDTGVNDIGTPPTDLDNTGLNIRVGGSHAGVTQDFDGKIAEIILLSTVASTSARQRIEGYLAHKWGLTANLPGAHPYKSSPPIVSGNWTPDDEIPLSLWFSPDSSYAAGTWEDLSANGWDFTQDVAGNRPTLFSANLNGHDVLDFDGNDYLTGPAGSNVIHRNVGHAWCAVMYRHDVADASPALRVIFTTSTALGLSRLFLSAGGPSAGQENKVFFAGRRLDGDSIAAVGSAVAMAAGQWSIIVGDNNYVARTIEEYQDGTIRGSASGQWTAPGNTSDTDSSVVRIASNSIPGDQMNGRIAELIVGNTQLTTVLRQKLEGYLAHKYGLSANLPIGHPYKDSAP